ncbi:Flp pilus assembly protein CpaB [Candidatus Margulisiibacteriota bacterium]
MGNVNKRMLIISLIFGIVTFVFTTMYLGKVAKETKHASELLSIIVAKVNIPPRSVITKEMLESKPLPRKYVLPGAISKLENAVGKISTTPIIPGEQVLSNKLAVRGRSLGLSFIIPKNKRAVSVEVDASASIAGLIKPGDMVDVLCTLGGNIDRTVTLLQNVPILAIDRQMESAEQPSGKINRSVIATFALDSQDAEKLVLGAYKGRLKLLLRPVDDTSIINSWGAGTGHLLPYRKATTGGGYNIRIIKGTQTSTKKL